MWLFSVNFALENHGSGIRVSFLGSIAEGKNNRETDFPQESADHEGTHRRLLQGLFQIAIRVANTFSTE